jgi:hypothetical protein
MSAFWGFNDCSPWSASASIAWLESDVYDRPPVKHDYARLMIRNLDGVTRQIAETDCWNFPQGARQQWVGTSDDIVINVRDGNHCYASKINSLSGQITKLAKPLYALLADQGVGLGLNFGRIQRLGGYGYAGLDDQTSNESAPEYDGIWQVPLNGGSPSLLLSLANVASFKRNNTDQVGHHYLTHILPSPSEQCIAFLHRFWLPDGGIHTRLLSFDLVSHQLHLWAEGYLSHFDWRDDDTLVIWGRSNQGLGKARQSAGLIGRIPRPLLHLAKGVLRPILGKSGSLRCNYLILRRSSKDIDIMAPTSLTMDGHPSFLPSNRDWMLSDTYPDKDAYRELFLMNWLTREKLPITRLKNDVKRVDMTRMSEAIEGIDKIAMANFKPKIFAFNRSGLYCDFHPRWKRDGTNVSFDANFEGSRHIYSVQIPDSLTSCGSLDSSKVILTKIA